MTMKLLIIDDDKIDRMNAVRVLKKAGLDHDVSHASTAGEGAQQVKSERFDAILLDFKLPDMDGLEFLKVIREEFKIDTAVLMLSHNEDDILALDCIEAGAQDFITKKELSSQRIKRAILHSDKRFKIENELRVNHDKMRTLAEQDALTGLASRYFFDKTLKNAVSLAKRDNKYLALVLLDLDNFKNVNDTLGHDVGDMLLKEVANILQEPIREGDILSRIGGDEFAILVQNLSVKTKVWQLINRILNLLAKPITLNNSPFLVTASIGIATFPDCATDASGLMKCADIAMYRSKDSGRNQAHFYTETINEEVREREILEQDLRTAVEQQQFVVLYQPQLSHDTHKVVGIEALFCWQHPKLGIVLPKLFLPIAEDLKLINKIESWVIDTACAQFSQWRTELNIDNVQFCLALNLSEKQLSCIDLPQLLSSTLNQYKIPAERIELELATDVLSEMALSSKTLQTLSELGIKLALAGVGSTASSLAAFANCPVDIIKIDKELMGKISKDEEVVFLSAINNFAKTLKLEVVGEGVTTAFQQAQCKQLKLDRIQGQYFTKPLTENEFVSAWLTESLINSEQN